MKSFGYGPDETAGDLTSRLATIAATLSVNALQSMEARLLQFHEQSSVGVCYAYKIKKSEAEVDWTQSAEAVRNQIHGLSPAPGAFSKVLIGNRHENIKFFRAEVATGTGSPGMLLSEDMRIACGVGAVRVLQGQRAGKAMMSGHELMRGAKLGSRSGLHAVQCAFIRFPSVSLSSSLLPSAARKI